MKRFWIVIFVALLASCSQKEASTLYGVSTEGTPFDLMERLVYDAYNECMPVEFLPMNGGMYIFAVLANGDNAIICCETDKNNQITNIKVSNTMLDINSQSPPPHNQ